MGADRTLLVWEQHENYHPTDMEPSSRWIDRDDDQIADLIDIGNYVLEGMDDAVAFANEMKEIHS